MKKIARFNILTFAMILVISAIGLGLYALNVKKAEEASVKPLPVQTSVAATNAPTTETSMVTPTPTESTEEEEDYDYSDVDLSNYKPHKLPKDVDEWTDEEWAWWTEAAFNFQNDYAEIFEDNFGDAPTEDVTQIAQNFSEQICVLFDDGGTVDDVAEGIVDASDSQKTIKALSLAVKPGVENFCPWNKVKLNS